MNLLTRGNDKIGGKVYAFNLPAQDTCPGMSDPCRRFCYASRGRWLFRAVREALAWNRQAATRPFFVEELCEELRRRKVRVLRLHSSGDFYSADYVGRWLKVLTRCPWVRAYTYTRSWRLDGIRPVLEEMAALPNFRMWFSADWDTGMPPGLPPTVKVAWLLTAEDEPVPDGVDLIFRVHRLRKMPLKRIGLTLVCPTEQGREHSTTCTSCGICWKPAS
jgi:hypothetical protein